LDDLFTSIPGHPGPTDTNIPNSPSSGTFAELPGREVGIAAINGEREYLTYKPKDGQFVELHPILMGG
jgi:hypothetical protein